MKCRNPPIVFTRIRSPRAKSTSTRIRSHFHLNIQHARVLVVWIIVAHFHLCSVLGTLSRYTVLEF